jgi:superfamily II DNA/RNA helicase
MGKFKKLGLKKDILDVLSNLRYKESFEVQNLVVPLIMKGENVVFTSRTGSGKTLAYLLGFLNKINPKHALQLLIMVPTRELCIQVGKEIKKICDPLNINTGVLYGGRDLHGDQKTIQRKNQIMVCTPGRIIQQINMKHIKVGEVQYLVYDESDQMFDDGFYKDCAYIKERVSADVQTVLSSATITDKVSNFLEFEIGDHTLLNVGNQIPENIVQEKIYCEKLEKNDLILKLFTNKKPKRTVLFCNTKAKTEGISEFLTNHKINAKPFSGMLEQSERQSRLALFKEGKITVLVTTDVAARGLHIERIDNVFNYDVPTRTEFYVHRIGRTGRIDAKGYSLTFICPEDVERFEKIEETFDLQVKEIKL